MGKRRRRSKLKLKMEETAWFYVSQSSHISTLEVKAESKEKKCSKKCFYLPSFSQDISSCFMPFIQAESKEMTGHISS